MDELEYVPCNLCGADNAKDLFSEAGFSIVKCRDCALVYVNPRLTGESRTNYYVERLAGANGENVSQLPESDLAHAAEVQEYFKSVDAELMSALMSALQRRVLQQISQVAPAGRFLDVGCGWGYLLKMARDEFGYDPYGIEPTKEIAEVCRVSRGLDNVVSGTINDTQYPAGFFNVVTLMDVLEHLPDPGSALAKINTLLVPGGAVFIKVPNMHFLRFMTNLLTKTGLTNRFSFLGKGLELNPREHLYNFSPKTLNMLLSKHGFEPRKLVHFSPLRNGNLKKDQLKRGYSLLTWSAKTLSAGQINLYPDMGILATKVS